MRTNDFSLRPCPFCGNPKVWIRVYQADGVKRFRDRYAVQCSYDDGGCGAESGHYHSTVEAMDAWNQRRRKWKYDRQGSDSVD